MEQNKDSNDQRSFVSKIPDSVKINLCRWWFFGAIYFFIAWGTNLGANSNPIDLIFFLGVAIGIANIFILNPILYSMFDIERNGKIINKKYYDRTIIEGVTVKLGEILKCLICSIGVFAIYTAINLIAIKLFSLDESEIWLQGEPILYGIFFLILYLIISKIVDLIHMVIEKKSGAK